MDSNKSLNGSTSKTQLDKKVKKRRGHKLTYHQRKRKCKMEECDVINNKRINQEGLENKSNGKDEKSAKYGGRSRFVHSAGTHRHTDTCTRLHTRTYIHFRHTKIKKGYIYLNINQRSTEVILLMILI